MFRRAILALLLVSAYLLVFMTGRAAGAYQDPGVNAVASAVAGHPVIASCAATSAEWSQFETTAGYTFEVDGFTFASRDNVIYLAPRVCSTLLALLNPAQHNDVGTYWAALALKVLIHESIHQRGVLAENVADCTAIPLVPQYAVSNFGYPATIKMYVYTRVPKTARYKRVLRTIPNPELARLAYWTYQWHLAMPSSYQGGC